MTSKAYEFRDEELYEVRDVEQSTGEVDEGGDMPLTRNQLWEVAEEWGIPAAAIAALAVGDSLRYGGGAGPVFELRRVQ
jgi:hypothetical protein